MYLSNFAHTDLWRRRKTDVGARMKTAENFIILQQTDPII
jgi:hypothetical protein